MARNFTSLSFHRENGFFQKNITKQRSLFHFLHDEDLTYSFYQSSMKNIYCLNSMKYHIPGNLEPEAPPYAAEFCTAFGSEHVFSVADEDGNVSLFSSLHYSSKSGPLMPLHKIHAHDNAIFDIAWLPKEHVVITASGDKTASIWDMVKGAMDGKLSGHSCSLRAVNVSKHNPSLLVTGSRDGNALVWDRRSCQPIIRIQDAHVVTDNATPKRRRRIAISDQTQLVNDSQQTVSCALFQYAQTVITAGTRDGTLKIWDLRKLKQMKKISAKNKVQPVETLPYPGNSLRRRGYTCLTLDSSSTHLYASCTDDSVYHYDLATSHTDGKRMPICRYNGHINSSFYVRTALSYNNQFLLGGSCDNKAYIWNADGKCELPLVSLASEAMSEVTAVAWSPSDITHLVTCSDDCVVRLWKMPYAKRENKLDVDGMAETVKKDVLGCKCGCNFSPISVVSRHPALDSPKAVSPLVTETQATPKKFLKDTSTSLLTTPSRKLVQTSVTSLFTPTRSANTSAAKTTTILTTPSRKLVQRSATSLFTPTRPANAATAKTTTPSRHASNCGESPESTHKCHAGTVNTQKAGKRRAFKSLDSEMNNCEVNNKENAPLDSIDSFTTPKKNWLLELTRKRRSESEKLACKRQRRVLSSPVSVLNIDKTPERQTRSISSYFKDDSLF